jgi:hypothetical protein
MNLRDFFAHVAATYDRTAPMAHPTQKFLVSARDVLPEHAPGGFIVIGSGGHGLPTFTPWVGFFNPDETVSPQTGIYVVYLFSSDLSRLTLTLLQGEEKLRQTYGDTEARRRLAADALRIRGTLIDEVDDLETDIDLGPKQGARQRAYRAGTIVATHYDARDLPTEEMLRTDLRRFLQLYEHAIESRTRLLLGSPGAISAPGVTNLASSDGNPLRDFKPKNDADYVATLKGRKLVKTRRHERLVRDYGEWAQGRGFTPATEHPKDLVLRKEGAQFLVEAKVVRNGNATQAVREAVGQLLTYSHFLSDGPPPQLVALLSEDVGRAYVQFLSKIGIGSVWFSKGRWFGSPETMSVGLAEGGSDEGEI